MSANTKGWLSWLIVVGAMFLVWTGLVDLADHVDVKKAAGRVVVGLALMITFQARARERI